MFIGDDYIPDQDYESEEEEEYYYYQDMIEAEKNRDLSWLYDEEDDPYADEEWRPVPGYEGLYEVSNMGRVKSLERDLIHKNGSITHKKEIILEPCIRHGYPTASLRKNNEEWRVGVHRLVAMAFIPNPENKPYVDHWDTDTTNNKVENLSWVTTKENANNPFTIIKYKNKIVSDETRQKIREYNLGKTLDEETRKKISEGNKGRKVSKETTQKILETKRKNNYNFQVNLGKHRVIDDEKTGKYHYE